MVKKIGDSIVAQEIKKEYLKEHLSEVKNLIEIWLGELRLPSPLGPDRKQSSWGWQANYTPSVEQDPDKNHMLRHHLKSRKLWFHHTNWERKLETVWNCINQVRMEINSMYTQKAINKQRQYTEDYKNTALWKGFEVACRKKFGLVYKIPNDQLGLSIGGYRIENSVTSKDERKSLEKEHRDLSHDLARTIVMKDLARSWSDIAKIQETMRGLAMKALKSSDILYPCRFCRHLWK